MTHEQRVVCAILNFPTSPNLADPVEVGKRLSFEQVVNWLDYLLFSEISARIQDRMGELPHPTLSAEQKGMLWAYRVCLAMLMPLGS